MSREMMISTCQFSFGRRREYGDVRNKLGQLVKGSTKDLEVRSMDGL